MLTVHLIIVVMLGALWTVMTILQHRESNPESAATPILPALAFITWLSAAYQSTVLELPYSYGDPALVLYEPYTGGAALAMYFLGLAGIMFIYLVDGIFKMMRK